MLRAVLVLAVLIVGFGASFRSRYAALLLYVWFALFRPQEWIWADIGFLHLSFMIGLILVVPSLLSGIFPNVTQPLSIGTLAFLICTLIPQFTGSTHPAVAWEWIEYFAKLALVCLLAVPLLSTRHRFTVFLVVVGGSLGFHSAKAGLAFLLAGGLRFGEGEAGAFVDSDAYALAIAMTLPLLVAAAQQLRGYSGLWKWIRWALYLAVQLSTLTLIGTFSRGGLLALAAGALALLLVQRRRVLTVAATAVALALAALFVRLPEGYSSRMQTITTYEEEGDVSALSRLHFWRVALDMAKANPTGVGLKNYIERYDEFDDLDGAYGTARSVHSSHLEVLAETGFAGATIWASMFVYAFLTCLKMKHRTTASRFSRETARFFDTSANALLASMTAFLVGGAFIELALNDLTWLTFGMVTSLQLLHKAAMSEVAATRPDTVALTVPAMSALAGQSIAPFANVRHGTGR